MKLSKFDPEKFADDGLEFAVVNETELRPELLAEPEEQIYRKCKGHLRRKQFCLGRQAARSALSKLDARFGNAPILVGERGMPVWPDGACGSISHCRKYSNPLDTKENMAVAVVGSSRSIRSIGVDVEDLGRPYASDLKLKIATKAEQAWLASEPPESLLILLSAKETLYKLIFPISGQYFGFQQAELQVAESGSGFVAQLLFPLPIGLSAPKEISIQAFQLDGCVMTLAFLTKI